MHATENKHKVLFRRKSNNFLLNSIVCRLQGCGGWELLLSSTSPLEFLPWLQAFTQSANYFLKVQNQSFLCVLSSNIVRGIFSHFRLTSRIWNHFALGMEINAPLDTQSAHKRSNLLEGDGLRQQPCFARNYWATFCHFYFSTVFTLISQFFHVLVLGFLRYCSQCT